MKPYINSYEDVFALLDDQVSGVFWDGFYQERKSPVPFLTQNTMPDENLAALLKREPSIQTAVELGCGEGRNAVYMAKQNISVTAYDLSSEAIKNAEAFMMREGVRVNFICRDVIKTPVFGQYDLVYDSGMLHHLAPHRRLTYLELLKKLLKPGGYFGLLCFAWGENCADEIDDWAYYRQKFNAGLAFQKERLCELFSPHFNVLEIRKYRNGIPGTIQGLDFMWACLFQAKN